MQHLADNLLTDHGLGDPLYRLVSQFGLPLPRGPLGFEAMSLSPMARQVSVDERSSQLIAAQEDCLALLPQLATALDRRRNVAVQRLEALQAALVASDFSARLVIAPQVRRTWRTTHVALGQVVVADGRPDAFDAVTRLAERALNPEASPSSRRQFRVEVRPQADDETDREER